MSSTAPTVDQSAPPSARRPQATTHSHPAAPRTMHQTSITDSDDSSDDSQPANDAKTPTPAQSRDTKTTGGNSSDGGGGNRRKRPATESSSSTKLRDNGESGRKAVKIESIPDILVITCGTLSAELHVSKLGQGSCGACIHYRDEWLTPNQLQMLAGKETTKDWKRSIRFRGQSMKWWVSRGLVRPHPSTCRCSNCGVKRPVAASRRTKSRRGAEAATPTRDVICADQNSRSVAESDVLKSDGVRVWSGATTTTSEADDADGLVDSPEMTSSNRKLRQGVKLTELEQGNCSTSGQLSIGEGGRMDQSFWNNLKLRKLSNDIGNSPLTDESRTPLDGEVKLNGSSSSSCSKPHISLIIQEQHLPVDPEMWSVDEVCVFIKKLGFGGYSCFFKENEVDGEALMLMREEHLLNTFRLKLGPALKLYKLIRKLHTLQG